MKCIVKLCRAYDNEPPPLKQVLSDGKVLDLMSTLRKDNTGRWPFVYIE